MNYINRQLVKQQAKNIINGKCFYIFLVTLVVMILTNSTVGFNIADLRNSFNTQNNFELFNQNNDDTDNFYKYYEDFDGNSDESSDESFNKNFDEDFDNEIENPFDDFTPNSVTSDYDITKLSTKATNNNILAFGNLLNGSMNASFIGGVIFLPLTVTLAGMYLSLVRRNPDEKFDLNKEFTDIFKNTFNNTYPKKLLTVLLVNLLTGLLSCLFIIPGIVFLFSSYFSNQIMSDNPNLKPTEAIKLSKKMVAGSRTELLMLELSFIPWYLLTIVTFGIATIYVTPYINTTRALYYENFRIRALQYGKITTYDFLSAEEKFSTGTQYGNNNDYGYGYGYGNSTGYGYDNSNNYSNDFGTATQQNTSAESTYYYSPTQPTQPPTEPTTPVEPSEPFEPTDDSNI